MLRTLAFAAAATLLAAPALADDLPVPSSVHFPSRGDALERFRWYGESSVYGIRILGGEAVRAGIQVGPLASDAELGGVIPIHVVGTTVGFFDTIYPIDNEALTLLGADVGLLPVYTDSDFNERDYVTRLLARYERDDFLHATIRMAPDTPDREEVTAVPYEIFDDLSMIYDQRSRDLTPGNGYVYYNHDGDTVRRMTITSTGTEELFTDLFGYVECYTLSWVVEPLESAPMLPFGDVPLPPTYRPSGEVYEVATSYVTTDERRIIIGANIDTSIGLMTIRVVNYTPPRGATAPAPVETTSDTPEAP